MINLLNEKLKHPYFHTEWTVIGYENGKLQCVSDKSSVTEWITREYGLELYAEEQKRRVDELENNINKLKQDLQEWIDYAEYLADQHSVYDYQRVLDRLNDL